MMLQLSKIKQVIAARKPQVILTMAVLVAFALVFSRPEKPLVEPPERSWNVEAVEANIDNLSPTLELFGTIRSPEDSRLSSALESRLSGMTKSAAVSSAVARSLQRSVKVFWKRSCWPLSKLSAAPPANRAR